MKKIFSVVAVIILTFSLASCTQKNDNESGIENAYYLKAQEYINADDLETAAKVLAEGIEKTGGSEKLQTLLDSIQIPSETEIINKYLAYREMCQKWFRSAHISHTSYSDSPNYDCEYYVTENGMNTLEDLRKSFLTYCTTESFDLLNSSEINSLYYYEDSISGKLCVHIENCGSCSIDGISGFSFDQKSDTLILVSLNEIHGSECGKYTYNIKIPLILNSNDIWQFDECSKLYQCELIDSFEW